MYADCNHYGAHRRLDDSHSPDDCGFPLAALDEDEIEAPVADALLWLIRAELKRTGSAAALAADYTEAEEVDCPSALVVVVKHVHNNANPTHVQITETQARIGLDSTAEMVELADLYASMTPEEYAARRPKSILTAQRDAAGHLGAARANLRRLTNEGWDD